MVHEKTYHQTFSELRCCVLIPTYNNAGTLAEVLDSVLAYTDQIIVVNDGSTDSTATVLEPYRHLHILHHGSNSGKGRALRTGFAKALELGYRYAITLDSDGQHKATDLPNFLEKIQAEPDALIVGARNMGQTNVPGTSSFGHRFSNFWYLVETGIKLPDTQSGYRLYPVEALKNYRWFTNKYEFEIEVMVRAAWGGIDITYVPIDVYYPPQEERITHFRLYKDFIRISVLNTFLVALAIVYGRPAMLYWSFKKKSIRKFINEHLLNSDESGHKLAGAIALGIFFGITPMWGYQWAGALLFAHIFKLNKVVAYAFTNISIPPMIPIILFASIMLGGMVVGDVPDIGYDSSINFDTIKLHLYQYLAGSLILATLAAALAGVTSYIFIKMIWRKK